MAEKSGKELKKRFAFKMPSTAALLFLMIVVVTVATYIIPAGEFQRVVDEETGRTVVVAGTFEKVTQVPVGVQGMFSSVYRGLTDAAEIIAFVFVVGGSFGLVSASGAINAALGRMIQRFSGKESVLIALLMTAFAICGATFGMAEETLPFVTILVVAALALGFDEVVGVAIVVVGVYCGYSAGPLNPFNTGIAQGIAELPLFSGLGLRVALMIGGLIIAVHHTVRYAQKIKAAGQERLSLSTASKAKAEKEQFNVAMTVKHKLVLSVLCVTIAFLIFGVLKYEWYFVEISALFLGMGFIVGGITYGTHFETVCNTFIKGAGEMTSAAIFVGLSRAILVVTQDGKIMDSIVNALSIPLSQLHSVFAAWGMYIAQGIINFILPSSTGQAVVVMPIMSSLSDLTGVTRQVAVLAFEAGDGYWNMITPTHPVVMAAIGLAGVSFSKWFKFAFSLVLKWTVWVLIILAIAVTINWGPF